MSNVLIVESENDKFFIEAIITHISANIEIGQPICAIDEYECLGGMGKLEERLRALTHRIIKGEIDRVIGLLKNEPNALKAKLLTKRIMHLYRDIDTSVIKSFNLESIIENIEQDKRKQRKYWE